MVYVFLADGFEEIEALTTVDILRRAELDVCTVGVHTITPRGAHDIEVAADIFDCDVNMEAMTALVLPGGMPGTLNLERSEAVQKALDYAAEKQLPIGAICAAPSILGHKGLLNSRKAVCFPGFEEQLMGAEVLTDAVVTDGNITTARGAGVAVEFALELVSRLVSLQKSERIKGSIQCR